MNRIATSYLGENPKVLRIDVAPKQREPQKSKCFRIIKLYYQFLCVFGMDFGFFTDKSYKQRLLRKTAMLAILIAICTCYMLFMMTQGIYKDSYIFIFTNTVFMIYYTVNALFLLMVDKNETMFSALLDLQKIDIALQVDLSYITEITMITFFSLHAGIKSLMHCVHCEVFSICDLSTHLLSIFEFFQQFLLIAYSLIFIFISYRFKKLLSVLNTDFDCHALQGIYKSIVNVAETQKKVFDPMFVFALLNHIPHLMLFIYECIFIGEENSIHVKVTLGVHFMRASVILHHLVLMLAPALCAGTLSSQTCQINFILHNKLIDVQDESRAREIERFILYVQERDCRFRVYQLIPLDASLIGKVLNFCITYMIVIIQFSIK